MRRSTRLRTAATAGLAVSALLCWAGPAARAQVSGGVPVRVPVTDGVPSRYIDPARDRVYVTLRRLVTSRHAGWFTKDNAVAIAIVAQVTTDPQPPKPLSFPLATQAAFQAGPAGQVSVPIEYPIVSGLALTQGDITYSSLSLELTLINLKKASGLGSALQALAAITGSAKLPIPASPYTQGLSYLLDFANTMVANDIKATRDEDKFKTAAMAFTFDPEGACDDGGDFERTGTKAVVFAAGDAASPAYVNIERTADYCWSADMSPTFVLKAARKRPQTDCGDASYQYQEIANNYTAFFVNKAKVARALGADAAARRDREESLLRCRANGIGDEAQCLGVR